MSKLNEDSKVICSVCKKREAVYKRRSSGELLCKLCLYRSLVKQVRKAIHYYKMVSKSSSILFIIRPEAVGESIIGFNIYKRATKDFNLDYNILCFNGLTNCEAVKKYLNEGESKFLVIETSYKTQHLVEIVKFVEAVATRLSRKRGINYVVTPLLRDELTLLSLLGILTVSRSVFSEGLPVKIVDDVRITRPFFYVVSPDMANLKAMNKVEVDPMVLIECNGYMQKAKKILFNSIELTYSSIKTVELLQSYIFGPSFRCKYCGALSQKNVCDVCERIQQYIESVEE